MKSFVISFVRDWTGEAPLLSRYQRHHLFRGGRALQYSQLISYRLSSFMVVTRFTAKCPSFGASAIFSKLGHHHERIQYGGLGNEHKGHVNSTIRSSISHSSSTALRLNSMEWDFTCREVNVDLL